MTQRHQLTTVMPEWRKPVIAVPLKQAFPELGEVKEFRSKVCLFNHDRSRIFDVVSARYQVIPHSEAVDRISGALEEYFGKKVGYDVRSINGGARVAASFKLPCAPIKIAKDDITEITLLLRNSYDRGWTFSAVLGAFRLACSNGMTIGTSWGSLKAKHVGNSEDSDLLDLLDVMISRAPTLKEVWKQWADTRIQYDDAHALLIDEFPTKYLDPILKEDRFPRSKWDLYNDLTRFSTHDTRSVQRRIEFDDKIAKLFYDDLDGVGDEEE